MDEKIVPIPAQQIPDVEDEEDNATLKEAGYREYDTTTLRTPYRFISLMLNMIFGRDHGKRFKLQWVPIIFYVAT